MREYRWEGMTVSVLRDGDGRIRAVLFYEGDGWRIIGPLGTVAGPPQEVCGANRRSLEAGMVRRLRKLDYIGKRRKTGPNLPPLASIPIGKNLGAECRKR